MLQFDERFALGLVLNRNRSSTEKIKGGLQAAQFQKDSPVGIILMKEQVDRIETLEGQVAALTAERDALRKAGGGGTGGSPTGGSPTGGTGSGGGTPSGGGSGSGGSTPGGSGNLDQGGLRIVALAAAEAFDQARATVPMPALGNHSQGNQPADQKHQKYTEEYAKNLAHLLDDVRTKLVSVIASGQS